MSGVVTKIFEQKNLIALCRVIIGVSFVFSAYSKLIAPGVFEITLIDQGFFTDRTYAAIFARLLCGVELGLGLLFFQPYYLKKLSATFTLVMLTGFTIYLLYLYFVKGDAENCGCFGELLKLSPLQSIGKNVVLMGLTVYIFRSLESRNERYYIPLFIVLGALGLSFAVAPIRSVHDFQFTKYTHFERAGRVDLTEGEKLVIVFDLECPRCKQTAIELGMVTPQMKTLPNIYVLFYGEGNITPDAFIAMTNITFPYTIIPEKDFFSLIGNEPPRVYWLKNGAIVKYWDEEVVGNLKGAFGGKY